MWRRMWFIWIYWLYIRNVSYSWQSATELHGSMGWLSTCHIWLQTNLCPYPTNFIHQTFLLRLFIQENEIIIRGIKWIIHLSKQKNQCHGYQDSHPCRHQTVKEDGKCLIDRMPMTVNIFWGEQLQKHNWMKLTSMAAALHISRVQSNKCWFLTTGSILAATYDKCNQYVADKCIYTYYEPWKHANAKLTLNRQKKLSGVNMLM